MSTAAWSAQCHAVFNVLYIKLEIATRLNIHAHTRPKLMLMIVGSRRNTKLKDTALGLELFPQGGGHIHGGGAPAHVELLEAAQLS